MVDEAFDLQRIQEELRRQERSQAWLGRRVGVKDPSQFNRYLRGRQRRPVDLAQRIAEVLGLPVDELVLERPAA